ncbi:MAG: Xaa-Pro peptidase family protein [Candidatus Micrarchaeota archaeon]
MTNRTKDRIKTIFRHLKGKDITAGAILLANTAGEEPGFFYATGISSGVFEASYAAIFADGTGTAIVPRLEAAIAEKELPANISLESYSTAAEFEARLATALRREKNIGLNYDCLRMRTLERFKKLLPGSKLADASKAISQARLTKDENEIAYIKRACGISQQALKALLESNTLRPDASEAQVAASLDYEMAQRGGRAAFSTIVAFGANSAVPHHTPTARRLKRGDLALIDFGAAYKRYCADMTRTFVCGRPNQIQTAMHSTVLSAQKAALGKMRVGASAETIHKAALASVDATEFRGKFIHSTGHSLGLEVHDGASLSNAAFPLGAGMVFTVEPGVYIKGVGGARVEDDVLIGKTGPVMLTTADRGLMQI